MVESWERRSGVGVVGVVVDELVEFVVELVFVVVVVVLFDSTSGCTVPNNVEYSSLSSFDMIPSSSLLILAAIAISAAEGRVFGVPNELDSCGNCVEMKYLSKDDDKWVWYLA